MSEKSDIKSNEVSDCSTKVSGNRRSDYTEWKAKRRELLDEKKRIEEQSAQSTKETLSLIVESEKIGVKTGRELVRQRETLSRVEDKLEAINGSLDESQRHLKSMKSVFSSFKNIFSKKSDREANQKCAKDSSGLKNFETNRVIDSIDEQYRGSNERDSSDCRMTAGLESRDPVFETNETNDYWKESKQINDTIEQNLNEIELGVERLKQLSLGLGQEIDGQNALIDRISKETERAELRIKDQNHEIRQLLRK